MVTEQDKALEALQIAIQMEVDGQDYYQKASRQSGNELGRKLLRSLAAEEDVHRRKFEEIYNAIRDRKVWPITDFQPDGGKGLRTIFARAIEEMDCNIEVMATELDVIQRAVEMENKSYDFYRGRAEQAEYDAERHFCEILASEEREHRLILLDYYQYLEDPASYFVGKEHPSLDGG